MDFTDYPLNVNVKHKITDNVNVRSIANKLVQALNDPNSHAFFCKVARALPEHVIWANLEQAQTKGRRPAAYFSTVCKVMMDN